MKTYGNNKKKRTERKERITKNTTHKKKIIIVIIINLAWLKVINLLAIKIFEPEEKSCIIIFQLEVAVVVLKQNYAV